MTNHAGAQGGMRRGVLILLLALCVGAAMLAVMGVITTIGPKPRIALAWVVFGCVAAVLGKGLWDMVSAPARRGPSMELPVEFAPRPGASPAASPSSSGIVTVEDEAPRRRRRRRRRRFRLRIPFLHRGSWGWDGGVGYVDRGQYTSMDVGSAEWMRKDR